MELPTNYHKKKLEYRSISHKEDTMFLLSHKKDQCAHFKHFFAQNQLQFLADDVLYLDFYCLSF